jgi:hypothetical protein
LWYQEIIPDITLKIFLLLISLVIADDWYLRQLKLWYEARSPCFDYEIAGTYPYHVA